MQKNTSKIILDKEDENLLKKHKWYLKDGNYPTTTIKGKNIYIHHMILNTNQLIDHKNRNPLDNRRCNLRYATKSTNAMNSKLRKDNTSGIKGVSWNKEKEKWEVYITKNKKTIKLGYFENIKYAALYRANKEEELFGEFANYELINNIRKIYG